MPIPIRNDSPPDEPADAALDIVVGVAATAFTAGIVILILFVR